MAKTYLDYLKEVLKGRAGEKEAILAQYENKYDDEKDAVKKEYASKTREKDMAYLDEVDKENVARFINERKMREAIGNMGLLNSGLKYKGSDLKVKQLTKENKEQRKAIEDEMNRELLEIDNKKADEIFKAEQKFDDEVNRTAEALYKEAIKTSKKASMPVVSLKEEKEPGTEEPKTENNDERLTAQNMINIGNAISKIITKSEYAKEKQINKELHDYDQIVMRNLANMWVNNQITKKELDYLIKYYNINYNDYVDVEKGKSLISTANSLNSQTITKGN